MKIPVEELIAQKDEGQKTKLFSGIFLSVSTKKKGLKVIALCFS